jgi:threonine/homoserine/homoserine lactone efflux protein
MAAYAVGVASPGPSNLAIMATAMGQGRTHALALAGGVVCGSVIWGIAAAIGLSALMHAYSWSLLVLKVLGGGYMLWLAWKAARTAIAPTSRALAAPPSAASTRQAWLRGMAMHLTNPKAIFVWLSIVALALPPDAGPMLGLQVVAACAVIGAAIFLGYALAFSSAVARRAYARAHRGLNATLALVFASAGVRLLVSRSS